MLDKKLAAALLNKMRASSRDFCEVFFERTSKTQIIRDNGVIEQITTGIDQGIALRVIRDDLTRFAFSSDLNPDELTRLALNIGYDAKVKLHKKITLKKQVPISRRKISSATSVDIQTKIKICELADRAARIDERITQVRVHYQNSERTCVIANSRGEFVTHTKPIIELYVTVLAKNAREQITIIEGLSGTAGLEILSEDAVTKLALTASKLALQNLDAPPAPKGVMPVVLASDAGGTIIHEAVGHGLEADIVRDGLSVYKGKLGKRVASKLITVIDDATLTGKRGSFLFDDEGTPAQKTILIKNGVLTNLMSDRVTAKEFKLKPSGNARRESYEFKPIVRMTNTFVAPGKSNPQDIIKAVKLGLYIKKMGGGQVNTLNGDFVFEAEDVHLIQNGQVGKPVKKISLTGNGPQILREVAMVGNDLGFSVGTCGKDGQGAPVTDAIPTMLIPRITVG